MELNRTLCEHKQELLEYFRGQIRPQLQQIEQQVTGNNSHKERAKKANAVVNRLREELLEQLKGVCETQNWTREEQLKCVLMIYYVSYIVMIEARNYFWPYEYMTFSRRIGELWEPFCRQCFLYSPNNIPITTPLNFVEVRAGLIDRFGQYINELNLVEQEREQLREFYNVVWGLVTSGEIQLKLDFHFIRNEHQVAIDFKSGFGSNEKGNTNRLLLVASIYNLLDPENECILIVRSPELLNNNYFQRLRNSPLWAAYCGAEAYRIIGQYTGFDLYTWIERYIDWQEDLNNETIDYLREQNLIQYLNW